MNAPRRLPADFETVLLSHVKRAYLKKGRADAPWNDHDTRYFARGIVELNRGFTQTRSEKAFNYFNDPVLRSGYLCYFLPVNAMKAYAILSRNLPRDLKRLAPGGNIRVADVGAGPLTLSFALLFFLADILAENPGATCEVNIDAFEQNAKILRDGRLILENWAAANGRLKVRVREAVGPFREKLRDAGTYDALLFGNILNEFSERGEQGRLVLNILDNRGTNNAWALFLEPGSKKFTRDLQALRDRLIENTGYRVVAPCLHQGVCPLNLAAKSDWCNFTQRWLAPDFIRDFDALTALKKEYLLYAYLLVTRDARAVPEHDAKDFLAISDLMRQKGRFEIVGCGPAGRARFVRSDRDKSSGNADLEGLSRGDRFRVPDFADTGYDPDRGVSVRAKFRIERTE